MYVSGFVFFVKLSLVICLCHLLTMKENASTSIKYNKRKGCLSRTSFTVSKDFTVESTYALWLPFNSVGETERDGARFLKTFFLLKIGINFF